MPVSCAVSDLLARPLTDRPHSVAAADGTEALDEAQLISAILDSVNELVLVLDCQGRIVRFNRACERASGHDAATVKGRQVREILPGAAAAWFEAAMGEAARAGAAGRAQTAGRLPCDWIGRDGARRRIEWSFTALRDGDGRATLVIGTGIDVTDRERAAIALRDSEQRFRDFVEAACDWFWEMDESLRFTYFSDRMLQVSGVSPADLLGRSRIEIAGGDPKDEHWRAHLADLAARKPFRDYRYRPLLRDGRSVLWSISGKPVFDATGRFRGYRGTGTDVTAQTAAERHAHEAQERFRELAEMLPEIIFECDLRGRLSFVNRQAFVSTGYAPEDLAAGFDIVGGMLVPEDVGKGRRTMTLILRGEPTDGQEFSLRRKDGTSFPVMVHCSPILRAGVAVGIRGIAFDITRAKRVELELVAAKNQAEAANLAKSQFLATMSHELRTPLNAILGFSEIIRDRAFGPDAIERYAEYAGDIFTSGSHLLDLINDILDISKVEAGKLQIEPKWLDLPMLLRASVRLIRERADEHGIAIALEIPSPPPRLCADQRAIKQIVFNLLSNAVKFSAEGGSVVVACAPAEDGTVAISVADDGIGIPADQLDRILRPFEQLDNRYARAEGGTGLGLTLVKALAELHGGSVVIESVLHVGTRVTVRLPCQHVVTNPNTLHPWTVANVR